MTIGNRIKFLRERSNISQTDLAEKIKCSKQTLYKYENNIISNIPSDKIELLAKHLNTTPSFLMGWTGSKATQEVVDPADNKKELYLKLLDLLESPVTIKENAAEIVDSGTSYTISLEELEELFARCSKDILYNVRRTVVDRKGAVQRKTLPYYNKVDPLLRAARVKEGATWEEIQEDFKKLE